MRIEIELGLRNNGVYFPYNTHRLPKYKSLKGATTMSRYSSLISFIIMLFFVYASGVGLGYLGYYCIVNLNIKPIFFIIPFILYGLFVIIASIVLGYGIKLELGCLIRHKIHKMLKEIN